MSQFALIVGHLFRSPEQRISKAGKPSVTATLKAKDGEEVRFWRIVAFSEATRCELSRLTDGDALTVQGAFKAETYERDGQTKLSLSIIADHVLALRQPTRKKEPVPVRRPEPASVPFDDALQF
jgi:single-stranded DNA-binding protein